MARAAMAMDGYYGDETCIPLQATVITHGLPADATGRAWPFHHIGPAFDAAVTEDLSMAAVVGGMLGHWVIMLASDELQPRTVLPPPCWAEHTVRLPGEPTSVVFDDDGYAWVQLREPAALVRVDPWEEALVANVGLAERSVLDTGHDLFHRSTRSMVACVSCHPEGREDGRVWQFSDLGPRRTQALDVGLEGSEPFHWRGELADVAAIVDGIFEGRMGGDDLGELTSLVARDEDLADPGGSKDSLAVLDESNVLNNPWRRERSSSSDESFTHLSHRTLAPGEVEHIVWLGNVRLRRSEVVLGFRPARLWLRSRPVERRRSPTSSSSARRSA